MGISEIIQTLRHNAGIGPTGDIGVKVLDNNFSSHEIRRKEGVEIFTTTKKVN